MVSFDDSFVRNIMYNSRRSLSFDPSMIYSCDKGQGLFQVFVGDIGEEYLVVKGSHFQRLQHFDIDLLNHSSVSMTSSGKNSQPQPSPIPKQTTTDSSPDTSSSGAFTRKQTSTFLLMLSIGCSILTMLL